MDLNLRESSIANLPSTFGGLRLTGTLDMEINRLTSLAESFCNLKVGGHLLLKGNQLSSLPANFGNVHAGGRVDLREQKTEIYGHVVVWEAPRAYPGLTIDFGPEAPPLEISFSDAGKLHVRAGPGPYPYSTTDLSRNPIPISNAAPHL